jgi:Ctr copper transporter family
MDMSSTGTMTQMMMVFNTAIATPLYSISWTPSTTAQYAGTCVFLIVLAVIFRGLLAFKSVLERKWLVAELNRLYVSDGGRIRITSKKDDDEKVKLNLAGPCLRPWRFSTDGPRAMLDTVVVGVGYLLMLAVMTMNVGYFMAILGGTFLGSLLVGRYGAAAVH